MDLLSQFYSDVVPLSDWLRDHLGLRNIEDDGFGQCLSDMEDVYVGWNTDEVDLKPIEVSQSQHSDLYEVILQTVKKMTVAKEDNILVKKSEKHGANAWNAVQLKAMGNSSINYLLGERWTKLLAWIGDKAMSRLLEMAVFVEVVPSCFIQLTGLGLPGDKRTLSAQSHQSAAKRRKTDHKSVGGNAGQSDKTFQSFECFKGKCHQRFTTCNNAAADNFANIPTAVLPRNRLLYYKNVREKITAKASMISCQTTGALSLYRLIFETNHSSEVQPPPRDSGIMGLLSHFLRNVKNCPFKGLLNYHCPLGEDLYQRRPSIGQKNYRKGFLRTQATVIPPSRLLNRNVHVRQVYLYLRAVLLRTVPVKLIGGIHNRNVILKKISFLLSMGKCDKMSLGQLMTNLKTKSVDWLHGMPSNNIRLCLLSRLVHWLFEDVVFVVLRTMFYITDTTFLGYKLLYYRQGVWNRITYYGLQDLRRRNNVKPLSGPKSLVMMRSTLGVSTCRFLPKRKALRPIVNMASTYSLQGNKKQLSINKQLATLHLVLTNLKDQNPSLIGHGVLGMDQVHSKWKLFTEKWRILGKPKLFFVKMDISRCYDSISQAKIVEVMKNILLRKEFIITYYMTVSGAGRTVRQRYPKKVYELHTLPDLETQGKAVLRGKQNTIFLDKMYQKTVTGRELMATLSRHIIYNLIRFGGSKVFVQTEGISQGSVVSTLLCHFYYADMERKYCNVDSDTEFLTRLVDDYLYVTPHRQKAINFLSQMTNGVEEYNCFTNKDKVLTNVDCPGVDSISLFSEEWFPWCGMLLSTKTLEVTIDYGRYIGKPLRDTMSLNMTKNPGIAIEKKLVYTVYQKCQFFVIDPSVNSTDRIIRNVFEIYVFTSQRFHVFVKKLPFIHHHGVTEGLLKGIISSLCECVQKKVEAIQDRGMVIMLTDHDIKWTCLHAYSLKLKKHKAQYGRLLKHVEKWKKQLNNKMVKEKIQHLQSVCGDAIPVQFESIM